MISTQRSAMQRRTARSDRLLALILAAVVLTLASCRGGDATVSSAEGTGVAEQTDKTDAAITAGEPFPEETDDEDRTGTAVTGGQEPVSTGETDEDTQTTGIRTDVISDTEPLTSAEITKDETVSSTEKETEEHPDDDNVDWDAWQT